MQASSRVQNQWLRLLGKPAWRPDPQIAQVEEGYYLVVCGAAGQNGRRPASEREDFLAVRRFVPHLDHTRAVYLNREPAYGLQTAPLGAWAGPLGRRIENGECRALAIVDARLFARQAAAAFRAAGWTVRPAADNLRVRDGQFTECANLPRGIVEMVFSRSTIAEAVRSLRADLAARFRRDARLFARFEKQFAHNRPAVLGRYFTASPGGSRVAAGWDYWQASHRPHREAGRILEEAMKEFEDLLAAPAREWMPALPLDCCVQDNIWNEVTHD